MRHLFRTSLALAIGVLLAGPGWAADHGEAPLTKADLAADLADVYAWHEGTKLTTIITFDGIKPPVHRQVGTFDAGVLYTVNIDNSGDFVPDLQIHARFVQNDAGEWGLVVENLPGAGGPVVGRVEKRLEAGSCLVFAGLRDDPFFFDLEGFRQTLQTGALSFDGRRDTFAGTNCTAIALQMDLAGALGAGQTINLWATTARMGVTP